MGRIGRYQHKSNEDDLDDVARAIYQNPSDDQTWLVFCDLLEEMDNPLSSTIRILIQGPWTPDSLAPLDQVWDDVDDLVLRYGEGEDSEDFWLWYLGRAIDDRFQGEVETCSSLGCRLSAGFVIHEMIEDTTDSPEEILQQCNQLLAGRGVVTIHGENPDLGFDTNFIGAEYVDRGMNTTTVLYDYLGESFELDTPNWWIEFHADELFPDDEENEYEDDQDQEDQDDETEEEDQP